MSRAMAVNAMLLQRIEKLAAGGAKGRKPERYFTVALKGLKLVGEKGTNLDDRLDTMIWLLPRTRVVEHATILHKRDDALSTCDIGLRWVP